MERRKWLPLVLLVAACGSGIASTSGGRAAVGVNLVSPVFFGSGTSAPANVEVVVENRSGQPMIVRSIRVESSGMMTWGIYPARRSFVETLAPGEVKSFPMFATAVAQSSRMTPNEPLTVRAVVQFDVGKEHFQEFYSGRAFEP